MYIYIYVYSDKNFPSASQKNFHTSRNRNIFQIVEPGPLEDFNRSYSRSSHKDLCKTMQRRPNGVSPGSLRDLPKRIL